MTDRTSLILQEVADILITCVFFIKLPIEGPVVRANLWDRHEIELSKVLVNLFTEELELSRTKIFAHQTSLPPE